MIIKRLQETLDEDQIRLCRKILKWVTTAKESLTVNQLTVAVAVRKNDKEIDGGELIFDPRYDIIAFCALLVEILSDDTVRIVHLSVKEYLYDPSRGEGGCPFSLSPASSNGDISSALLTLLSFDQFAAANSIDLLDGLDLADARKKIEAQAMLTYGLRNWHLHCIDSGSSPKYQNLLDQVKQYVSSDYSYLWMEHLAKHERGPSWIHIENDLADWAGQRYTYDGLRRLLPVGKLLPDLVYFITLRRLEHLQKHLGPNPPKALTALANYAYVFGNIGNWAAAEKLELEVLGAKKICFAKKPSGYLGRNGKIGLDILESRPLR